MKTTKKKTTGARSGARSAGATKTKKTGSRTAKSKVRPAKPARAAGKAVVARRKPARKKAAPEAVRKGPAENPEALALARKIAHLLADKKATDVVVLDVRGIASYTDYVVIASGESDRQVTAMAENVQQKLKEERGLLPVGAEGQETGQWVLLDYGDVVAHVFYSEAREHYDLEGLWADAKRETVA